MEKFKIHSGTATRYSCIHSTSATQDPGTSKEVGSLAILHSLHTWLARLRQIDFIQGRYLILVSLLIPVSTKQAMHLGGERDDFPPSSSSPSHMGQIDLEAGGDSNFLKASSLQRWNQKLMNQLFKEQSSAQWLEIITEVANEGGDPSLMHYVENDHWPMLVVLAYINGRAYLVSLNYPNFCDNLEYYDLWLLLIFR